MSRSEGTAAEQFLHSIIQSFRAQKRMAELAIEQLPDEKLHLPLDANTNAICVIMKHVSGNLRSRFTDFLTTDGDKPDRDRDSEFVDDHATRERIMAHWEAGWRVAFDSMESLKPEDLTRQVTIRLEPYGVIDALHRSLAHVGYHVGQIVQLARFLAKDEWQTLTVPRGGSQAFNQAMREKHGNTS